MSQPADAAAAKEEPIEKAAMGFSNEEIIKMRLMMSRRASSNSSLARNAIDIEDTGHFVWRYYSRLAFSCVTTVILGLLAICMAALFIIGMKHIESCPFERLAPIYLAVKGGFGLLSVGMVFIRQIRFQRSDQDWHAYENDDASQESSGFMIGYGSDDYSDNYVRRSSKFTEAILLGFLIGWFGLGNYIFWAKTGLHPPSFHMTLQHPKQWCEASIVNAVFTDIIIGYSAIFFLIFLTLFLIVYHRVYRYLNKQK